MNCNSKMSNNSNVNDDYTRNTSIAQQQQPCPESQPIRSRRNNFPPPPPLPPPDPNRRASDIEDVQMFAVRGNHYANMPYNSSLEYDTGCHQTQNYHAQTHRLAPPFEMSAYNMNASTNDVPHVANSMPNHSSQYSVATVLTSEFNNRTNGDPHQQQPYFNPPFPRHPPQHAPSYGITPTPTHVGIDSDHPMIAHPRHQSFVNNNASSTGQSKAELVVTTDQNPTYEGNQRCYVSKHVSNPSSACDNVDDTSRRSLEDNESSLPKVQIQEQVSDHQNCSSMSDLTSTTSKERELPRLPYDFLPDSLTGIDAAFCIANWDHAFKFNALYKGTPVPDDPDSGQIEDYMLLLRKFYDRVKKDLNGKIVKRLVKFCVDNQIPDPPNRGKPSEVCDHVLRNQVFYTSSTKLVDLHKLSLNVYCSLVVYESDITDWVSDAINDIEKDYRFRIDSSPKGNFVYKILDKLKNQSAETMRERMVKKYGMCFFTKKARSTEKLFGKDAEVDPGKKLVLHCGAAKIHGYLYHKVGWCMPVSTSSIEYKLGSQMKKLLQSGRQESYLKEMNNIWEVSHSIYLPLISDFIMYCYKNTS